MNFRRNISKDLVVKFASYFAMTQEAFSRSYELVKPDSYRPSVVSSMVNEEVIREVEVVKKIDFDHLLNGMNTVEVLKKVVSSKNKNKKDNLKKIPGVGKKIEELLNAAGINTYSQLSKMSQKKIREILQKANISPHRYSVNEWPKKAKQEIVTDK